MNKPTVIYVRRQSTQPEASDCTSMPRRGAPLGVVAYNYVLELDSEEQLVDSYLEFSFALANSKHDIFDRKLSRKIVLARLDQKKDYTEKNGKQVEPNYHLFDIPQQESALRPYDALKLILRGHYDHDYELPPRLVNSLEQMLVDNELRNTRLEYLQTEGAIVSRVRDLLKNNVSSEDILAQLGRVRVGALETLAPETLIQECEEERTVSVVESTR